MHPFFTKGEQSSSQSHFQPELPWPHACSLSADGVFFKTQGSHILSCVSGSCSRKTEDRVSCWERAWRLFHAPRRCLYAGRKTFLICNACRNRLNVHLAEHHKVLHTGLKRKAPCLHNSISFTFSPLLMTFIIHHLFCNCFQALDFFFPESWQNTFDNITKHESWKLFSAMTCISIPIAKNICCYTAQNIT